MTGGGVALRQNALGVAGIAFLVISAAGPLGYLGGFLPLMIGVGGVAVPVAFLGAGAVVLLFLAGFTAMTPYVRSQGAFYAYISVGLGRVAGTAGAIVALLAYNIALIGALGLMSVYVVKDAEAISGLVIPWPIAAAGVAAVTFVLAATGIGIGTRVLATLLTVELLLVLVVTSAVLIQGGSDGLDIGSLGPANAFAPGMGAVLALAFIGFLGIEAIALYRGEARDPDRSIPRAGVVAVAVIAVFYSIVSWVVVQGFGVSNVVGAAEQYGANLIFELADRYLGGWASATMQVLVLASLVAAQLAFHNGANRYAHSLALDGILPRWVARTSPRTGAPWVAGLVQSIVSVITIVITAAFNLDPYLNVALWLTGMAAILMIVLQLVTSASVVRFFWRTSDGRLRRTVAPVLATILLVAALGILIAQFSLLTGASPEVNDVLLTILGSVVAIAILSAVAMRIYYPERIALIGIRAADDPNISADHRVGGHTILSMTRMEQE